MNQYYTRTEIHNSKKARHTISTLLVPSNYLDHFQTQSRRYGSKARYFKHLLRQFGSKVQFYETRLVKQKDAKWKTCYQKSGQCLKRCNFRPDPEYWEQLRHTANSFGISMCYLFVFLMELEMFGPFPANADSCASETNQEYKRKNHDLCRNSIKNLRKKSNLVYSCSRRVDFLPNKLRRRLFTAGIAG